MKSFAFLRVIFSPLSIFYRIIINIRNFLFDKGLIKITSFEVPVISVGNLSAGGTGKTPVIIYLLQVLGESFKKPAVVTRGYGRKTKGCVVVSDGNGVRTEAHQGGDEPLLIARRHPHVVVIASERRTDGIRTAVNKYGCDIILLDDAFQHRFVKRDCDIVLVNAREGRQGTKLLPYGNLREPLPNAQRADIVLITKGSAEENERLERLLRKNYHGALYFAEFTGDVLVQPDFLTTQPLASLYGKRIAAFCGIAHPQEFFDELRKSESDLCETLSFPDHYNYSQRDIYQIIKSIKESDCEAVVTTEKDLVRLNEKLFSGIQLYALRLSVSVTESFADNIRTIIDKGVSY